MSSKKRMFCRAFLLGALLLACPVGLPEEARIAVEEELLVQREERRVESRRILRRPEPPPLRRVSACPPTPSPVHPASIRDVSRLVRPPTV